MSDDPKSTPKAPSVICGNCGAPERDGVIKHQDDCPDRTIDRGRARDDEPTKRTGPGGPRVQLMERDKVRIDALRGIFGAARGVVGAVLDGQFDVKHAAETAPGSQKIDAVIDAGTRSAGNIASALGGVQDAVRRWPGTDPATHSTARYVVRRRVTSPGVEGEQITVAGEGESENAGSDAYDDAIIREAQKLAAVSDLIGGTVVVVELLERKPGGLVRRRHKRFEVPR